MMLLTKLLYCRFVFFFPAVFTCFSQFLQINFRQLYKYLRALF